MDESRAQGKERASLLVVDDEEELLQVFAEFLGGGEYDLSLARTGTEAIGLLGERHFDLVVTDLNLPGADGLAVLREAKTTDAQTEVIVLTGNASTLTAIEALRQGAYDYVLKPFDLFEMDQTIHKALERRRLLAENRSFVESLQEANEELRRNQEALRRHRDELRGMVEEATLRVRTLYEVGKEITSSLHLERTLNLILERSLQLTSAGEGALFLLEESSGQLECRVKRGRDESSPVWDRLLECLTPVNDRVLHLRQPVQERVSEPETGPRLVLVVPLLQEEEVTGTVAVLASGEEGFSPDDQEILVSLVAQATIAIHNAKVYGKIRDLDRMKSEFVAVVSHEVRTPLTSIKGTLEILADDHYFKADPSQKELLSICQVNVERLEALINDILDFSKLESSRLSSHFAELSFDGLAQGVVVNISNQAKRKQIQILREIPPDLPPMWADELRMVQVMNNLLSNAIKFSPNGAKIRVCARSLEGGVQIDIHDQGIGISPENLPKLFTRFSQLDSSSTRRAGGTGLGLVICKGIVEEHGGRIWAESTIGQGSCFSFWIPAGPPEPAEQVNLRPPESVALKA